MSICQLFRESLSRGSRAPQWRAAESRRRRCPPSTPGRIWPEFSILAAGAASLCLAVAGPVHAQRGQIGNELGRCTAFSGPALKVTVSGIRSEHGFVRVQSYRGTASDWLQKGRWINRIEVPAGTEG